MWHKSLIIFITTAAMSMSADTLLLLYHYSSFIIRSSLKMSFCWIQRATVINFYWNFALIIVLIFISVIIFSIKGWALLLCPNG